MYKTKNIKEIRTFIQLKETDKVLGLLNAKKNYLVKFNHDVTTINELIEYRINELRDLAFEMCENK